MRQIGELGHALPGYQGRIGQCRRQAVRRQNVLQQEAGFGRSLRYAGIRQPVLEITANTGEIQPLPGAAQVQPGPGGTLRFGLINQIFEGRAQASSSSAARRAA